MVDEDRPGDGVVLVTGATSGIGRALAEALSAGGASVALVARDPGRGAAAREAIAAATGNQRVTVLEGDLASLASVRELARTAASAVPRLDAIVHCAGVYRRTRSITADGFETMFATNVLGPFLLTNLLLPRILASRGRILVLSAPATNRIDFDDLQSEQRFRSLSAFGASKAADLVFTFELARRIEGTGATANAVHPGLVRTTLMRDAVAPLRWATWAVSRSARHAAASIVPLIVAPDYAGQSGRFFKDGRAIDPPAASRDPEIGRRLWEICARLSGLDQPPAGSP